MSCQVTWPFSKLLMLVNGGGVSKALSRCVAIIIYHIYVVGGLFAVRKLLDLVEVECLDNQQIEGDFTTVILCMYH